MAIKVVGLTGGMGSGKSAVADLFSQHHIVIVDTDKIARTLTGPEGEAMGTLSAAFGETYILADGSLNRPAMRQHIFSDNNARLRLEAILHPLIMVHSMRQLQRALGPYALLVVPLLFETKRLLPLVARTLNIDCREELQIQRVLTRSGLDISQIQAIMAAQCSRAARNALADDIIDNNGGLDDLKRQVAQKHHYYKKIFV